MERTEIPQNLQWNLTHLYESEEAWEKACNALAEEYQSIDLSQYVGKLGDKETLLSCLKCLDGISRQAEKLYLYAHMLNDQDVRVSKNSANVAKIYSLYTTIFAGFSFVEPELTSLDESYLKGLLKEEAFSEYDYQLKRVLDGKEHVLSSAEEKILALAGDVMGGFRNVFSLLDNANLNLPKASFNGEEIQMSHGMYGLVLQSGKREERKEWFEKYYEAYIKLIDTIAQTYYSNVKKNVFYKTVRKYDSCLEMALAGEDVDRKVYDNLISSTHNALPILHEYMKLRKQIFGFDEQHMYDIYLPLVEDAEMKLSFDDAYAQVVEGLAPLGKDYQALLMKGKEEGWIDVCENAGKRSGAYSTGAYDSPHPYVLLNYQPTTNDVFTIAHEMGHALHTYKSNESQPYSKAGYKIFVAEIASTVNEVLLLKHLYKKSTDKNMKKYLLNHYMDMLKGTLFRQTQFAEFEQLAHEKAERGEALTKENLSEIYYGLNKQYYGEGITHDKQIAYEWSRIPHFYTSFYVYKYATGIISAISIVKRILTEGESAVKDYFTFLSAGGSTDPVSILKKAGVDLTTETPFKTATQEFKDTLEEFKSLL